MDAVAERAGGGNVMNEELQKIMAEKGCSKRHAYRLIRKKEESKEHAVV